MLAAASAPLYVGGLVGLLLLQFAVALFVASIAVLELVALSVIHAASVVLASVSHETAAAEATSHAQEAPLDARLLSTSPLDIMLAIRAALSAPSSSGSSDVCASLMRIADGHPELSPADKASFFTSLRHAHGRSALVLSGGGALALSHLGVVSVLSSRGLLPRVVSGTSGGALVAAAVGMCTDAQLASVLLTDDGSTLLCGAPLYVRLGIASTSPSLSPQAVTPPIFLPLPHMLAHFAHTLASGAPPALMDSARFAATLRSHVGDETFLSAFTRTGRVLCITVTAWSGGAPAPLLLSYVTAPHVMLWSAVAASCALPGLMASTVLLARDEASGEAVPFHANGLSFADGSIKCDVPASELGLVFHARRLLVSQVNPHITPLLPPVSVATGRIAKLLNTLRVALDTDVRHRVSVLTSLGVFPRVLEGAVSQAYCAGPSGVTIVPRGPALSIWRVIAQPSPSDMRTFFLCGVAATMEQLPQIEALVAVEKVLSHCVSRYESFAPPLPPTFVTAATLGSSTADALRPTISSWARINLGARYAHVAGSWGTGLAAAGGPSSTPESHHHRGGTSPGSVQSPLVEAGEGAPTAPTSAVTELLPLPPAVAPTTPTVDHAVTPDTLTCPPVVPVNVEALTTTGAAGPASGPPHTDEAQEAAC